MELKMVLTLFCLVILAGLSSAETWTVEENISETNHTFYEEDELLQIDLAAGSESEQLFNESLDSYAFSLANTELNEGVENELGEELTGVTPGNKFRQGNQHLALSYQTLDNPEEEIDRNFDLQDLEKTVPEEIEVEIYTSDLNRTELIPVTVRESSSTPNIDDEDIINTTATENNQTESNTTEQTETIEEENEGILNHLLNNLISLFS